MIASLYQSGSSSSGKFWSLGRWRDLGLLSLGIFPDTFDSGRQSGARLVFVERLDSRGEHPLPVDLLGSNEVARIHLAPVFGQQLEFQRLIENRWPAAAQKTAESQAIRIAQFPWDDGIEILADDIFALPTEGGWKTIAYLG